MLCWREGGSFGRRFIRDGALPNTVGLQSKYTCGVKDFSMTTTVQYPRFTTHVWRIKYTTITPNPPYLGKTPIRCGSNRNELYSTVTVKWTVLRSVKFFVVTYSIFPAGLAVAGRLALGNWRNLYIGGGTRNLEVGFLEPNARWKSGTNEGLIWQKIYLQICCW